VLNFCCGCQEFEFPVIESINREPGSHPYKRNDLKNMESQSKAKRSKAVQLIALGSLLSLSTSLTGCSTATQIASKDKEKDKDKEENTTSGGSHFHGGGFRTRRPVTSASTRPASGSVSRGWFGGFRFCLG
jgi:hypothetical protein